MRHKKSGRKLNRMSSHRVALARAQATALLRHEKIQTTLPKAKELRSFVEKLITIAVEANREGVKNTAQAVHRRRLVAQEIHDREVLKKLFDEIAPKYLTRPGGYTRVLKIGAGGRAKREKAFMRPGRRGDQAQMALIALVE